MKTRNLRQIKTSRNSRASVGPVLDQQDQHPKTLSERLIGAQVQYARSQDAIAAQHGPVRIIYSRDAAVEPKR